MKKRWATQIIGSFERNKMLEGGIRENINAEYLRKLRDPKSKLKEMNNIKYIIPWVR